MFKQESVSWPGIDNLGEYISQDQEGNIHMMSTDFVEGDDTSCTAEIILSSNGFQLTVNYLLPLSSKKPEWTEIDLNETARSIMSQTGVSKRLKMVYQHARVTQLFTILDFPERWSYPVSLLIYLRRSIVKEELAVAPNFPKDFDECPERYYEELVPGKEYTTMLPSIQGIQKEDVDKDLKQTCGGISLSDLQTL